MALSASTPFLMHRQLTDGRTGVQDCARICSLSGSPSWGGGGGGGGGHPESPVAEQVLLLGLHHPGPLLAQVANDRPHLRTNLNPQRMAWPRPLTSSRIAASCASIQVEGPFPL